MRLYSVLNLQCYLLHLLTPAPTIHTYQKGVYILITQTFLSKGNVYYPHCMAIITPHVHMFRCDIVPIDEFHAHAPLTCGCLNIAMRRLKIININI